MYYHRVRDKDRREHCDRDREHWGSKDPHNHRFAGVTGKQFLILMDSFS